MRHIVILRHGSITNAWGSRMVRGRRRSELARRPGRHRRGSSGLTWCREYVAVAAALAGPTIARRGLFETLFATARHAVGAVGAVGAVAPRRVGAVAPRAVGAVA
jgi:hypothetical protein